MASLPWWVPRRSVSNTTSGSYTSTRASRSPRLWAANPALISSRFSCDILRAVSRVGQGHAEIGEDIAGATADFCSKPQPVRFARTETGEQEETMGAEENAAI